MTPFEMPLKNPRAILQTAGRYAKKSLGQHFLIHSNTANDIIHQGGISCEDQIIEIGPGLGALTLPLSKQAKFVHAIDVDSHLLDLLSSELAKKGVSNVNLIHGDILKTPFDTVISQNGHINGRWVVMGNLPYHISSQIIVKLIKERHGIDQAIVMLQKEMADRIQSPPGSKSYGRLSVMLQYCAWIKPLITISGQAFFPRVKVDSQVIQIDFRDTIEQPVNDERQLFSVVKAAFGKRRKTIGNALRSGLSCGSELITTGLQQADIDPMRRAETLSVQEFVGLTNMLSIK